MKERYLCKEIIERKGLSFSNPVNFEQYIETLSTYKYAICPPGNGIDTHRLWECIYLNVIPIVKRSIFTEKLNEKYKCIILDDWNDFDKEKLSNDYNKENVKENVKENANKYTMIHLCTFGNMPQFEKSINLFIEEAKNSGYFNTMDVFTQNNLPSEYVKFSESNPRGFGYWSWKPYIIRQMMKHYSENDIIIYADAGCVINLNENAKNKFKHWIDDVLTHPTHRLSFQMKHLLEDDWTKKDLIEYMDCANDIYSKTGQYSAAIQIYMNTKENREFIDEIIRISKVDNWHYISDESSRIANAQTFKDHRHDQSIYSLMIKKHGSLSYIDHWYDNNYPISANRRKF
jgi:hypothetical protein